MGKFDEYLDRAKDLAAEAGDAAKTVADDVVSRAKDLTEEGSAARELAKSAKGQAVSIAEGAKEKVQGLMQDVRAVKDIGLGIAELEALSGEKVVSEVPLTTPFFAAQFTASQYHAPGFTSAKPWGSAGSPGML